MDKPGAMVFPSLSPCVSCLYRTDRLCYLTLLHFTRVIYNRSGQYSPSPPARTTRFSTNHSQNPDFPGHIEGDMLFFKPPQLIHNNTSIGKTSRDKPGNNQEIPYGISRSFPRDVTVISRSFPATTFRYFTGYSLTKTFPRGITEISPLVYRGHSLAFR